MAKTELKKQEKLQQEKVEEKVSQVEQFFNDNKKTIWGSLCAILVIGLGILAYNNFVRQPKIDEALSNSYKADEVFMQEEYELALNGDGTFYGYKQIIDEYGAAAGEAVYFYAGICELKLNNWQNAIDYLKKYNGKDTILAAKAIAAQGTAYEGLEDYQNALACYEKAARYADNLYSAEYLLNAGIVAEELGQTEKALGFYKEIKDQYPTSIQAMTIDKYISRIETTLAK